MQTMFAIVNFRGRGTRCPKQHFMVIHFYKLGAERTAGPEGGFANKPELIGVN